MKAVSRLFYYISIVLTFTLAAVTISGALVAYAAPENWPLMPFIGLALSGILLLNLVVAFYWLVRWRCWVFVPLIAILCNWGYLSRIWQPPFSKKIPETGVLTVATYNVDSFGNEQTGYSCKEMAKFLKEHKVDIICFQEFAENREFTVDSIKEVLAEWPYYIIPHSEDSIPILQIAIFSRYPLAKHQLITYPDSRNCSMWCDVELPQKTIRIFNNHLQTTEVSQNRRRLERELRKDDGSGREKVAATRLMDGLKENFNRRAAQAIIVQNLIEVSPYPTLVCGDFNSLPSSYTYRTMKGDKLLDGFQTCGHGYMYTFRYFKHLLRIDYILHTKDFKGIDYFSPDLNLCSDHNPVVMKLII